ncbi:MAG TPA: C39 family peptidase [Chloroflexia bacterium]|nr:C39 family peptidase [Chloroflexia bacterium]
MSQNVSVKLSTNLVRVMPGDRNQVTITITNHSQGVERFEVRVSDLPAEWYQLDRGDLLLYPDPPGNEAGAYLTITVPGYAMPGSYSPVVQVINSSRQLVEASASFALFIGEQPQAQPEIHLNPPLQLTRARKAAYQLTVVNPQNQPLALRLLPRSFDPRARLAVNPPILQVPPLGQAFSAVEVVTPRSNWFSPDRRYEFMVEAENTGLQARGAMTQTCRLPWLRWLFASPLHFVPLLLLLLLFSGLLVFLLWPRQTTVVQVFSQPARCVLTTATMVPSLHMGSELTDVVLTETETGRVRKVQQESVSRLPGIFDSLLSLSPDGKQLAYVTAANEAMDDTVIFVVNLSTSTKQRIAGIANGFWPEHPIWSPDGSQLSYVVRNGSQLELWTVNLTSGDKNPRLISTPRQLTPDMFYRDPGPNAPLCWSSDGTRLVIAQKDATTQTEVNLANGQTATVNKPAQAGSDKLQMPRMPGFGGVVTPGLAQVGEGSCFVPTFSQNDPQWHDLVMRPWTDKIAAAGCALTATAMVLNYYKVNTDPNELNACLGDNANPYDWTLPANICSDNQVQGGQRDYFSWDGLNQILSTGKPAVVGMLGGQTGVHYVVVVGGSDGIADTYRVNDPWDGTNSKSLGYFLDRGYQLRWLVTYAGNNAPTCTNRLEALDKQQPDFSLRLNSPEDGGLYNQPVTLNYQSAPSTPISATLYTVSQPSNGDNQVPANSATQSIQVAATGSTGSTSAGSQTGRRMLNLGDQVDQEGSYDLVLETGTDSASGLRVTTHFVVDKTPPQLELVPRGNPFESKPGPDGVQIAHGKVDLDFKAVDNLSGITSIEYKINGGNWQPYTNDVDPKPVSFTNPGDYTLVYRSMDGAGNLTPEQTLKFTINLTAGDPAKQNIPGVQIPGQATPAPQTTAATDAGAGSGAGAGGNAANGENAGGNNGGSNAGGAAAATTTPAATVAPAALTAAPAQLTFDVTQDQASLQLINAGASPAIWAIQPPSGAAAAYLKFPQAGGTVPAGGSLPIQVQLAAFNLTGNPLTVNFIIGYNNNTAQLPITVLINPQPAPSVQFTSPAAGPLTTKVVPVKLQVTATGLAKPNHATLSATYLDKVGGTVASHPLPAVASADTGWTSNWDITGLPPQDNIQIGGVLCWTADDSNCLKIDQPLAGLSIPKPSATISFTPDGAALVGIVTITAQPSGVVTVDHITYTFTYKSNGNNVVQTIADRATAGNNYTVKWDTGPIPPQTGIKMDALICWAAGDQADRCVAPASPLPTFSVDAPTITVNPLPDAAVANLPAQLTLTGTAGKLNSAATTVWVDYTYTPTPGGTPVTASVQATLSTPDAGNATWTANLDTSAWPPQTATFTPKVCWDGNRTGNYCVKVPAPLSGQIPDLAAVFADPKPADLSKPVTLQISATPVGRVTSVKILLSYTSYDGTAKTDVPLPTEANTANNFAVTLDSVALGLPPNQPVNFKLKACNATSGYCGKVPDAPLLTIQAPNTTLDQLNPATLTTLTSATVPVQGVIKGRGVSSFTVSAVYSDVVTANNQTTLSQPVTQTVFVPGPLNLAQPFNFTWDTSLIPPQSGISLIYQACWGTPGGFDSGCANQNIYTGVTIAAPAVSKVFLTSGLEYNKDNTLTLPIPYDSTNVTTTTQVKLPLVALASGSRVTAVNWRLDVQGLGAADGYPKLVGTSGAPDSNGLMTATVTLDLGFLVSKNIDFSTAKITLIGTPLWNGRLEYIGSSSVKNIPLRFLPTTVNAVMRDPTLPATQIAPATANPDPSSLVMLNKITNLQVLPAGPTGNDGGIIKRVLLDVTYTDRSSGSPAVVNKTLATITTATNGSWNFDWDHTQAPLIEPQDGSTQGFGITLGWRFCNTPAGDDSGCLPAKLPGTLFQSTKLSLGGVRLTSNSENPVNSKGFLNSTFTAALSFGSPATVKAVRFIAYPAGQTTDPSKAILLAVHETGVTTNNQYHVYWPDNSSVDDLVKSLNTAGVTAPQVTIAAQYCLVASPSSNVNDINCSDWTGKQVETMTAFLGADSWKSTLSGQQGVVVTWEKYGTQTDPYNDYLKPTGSTSTSVTLQIKIIPVLPYVDPSNAGVVPSKPTLAYSLASGISGAINDPAATLLKFPARGAGYSYYYTYSANWDFSTLTLPQDSPTVRSVSLQASVSFTNAQNQVINSDAFLLTHGAQ